MGRLVMRWFVHLGGCEVRCKGGYNPLLPRPARTIVYAPGWGGGGVLNFGRAVLPLIVWP
jgi:hypothetical protein